MFHFRRVLAERLLGIPQPNPSLSVHTPRTDHTMYSSIPSSRSQFEDNRFVGTHLLQAVHFDREEAIP